MSGTLITFEGTEGAGKSTQIALLAERLRAAGRTVLLTREPGGTALGEEIRHMIKFAEAGRGMCARSELLLFCASRAQLLHESIGPALASGAVVLADRFYDSSTVYQGVARGLPLDEIRHLHRFTIGTTAPALTLVLDMPAEEARLRAMRRPKPVGAAADRMEEEPPEFYEKVRQGYLQIAREEPARVKVIPSDASREAVAITIWEEVSRVLGA